jgi:hypothetical protein
LVGQLSDYTNIIKNTSRFDMELISETRNVCRNFKDSVIGDGNLIGCYVLNGFISAS